jgi:hypothetical protein
LTPANEISLPDSYKRTLSKRCIDPLRPPDFLGLGCNQESLTSRIQERRWNRLNWRLSLYTWRSQRELSGNPFT